MTVFLGVDYHDTRYTDVCPAGVGGSSYTDLADLALVTSDNPPHGESIPWHYVNEDAYPVLGKCQTLQKNSTTFVGVHGSVDDTSANFVFQMRKRKENFIG